MPEQHVIERRVYRTEFRDVPGSHGRQRWATAVTYGGADQYGTLWLPSCFNAGLEERMPTILYGHDWTSLEHVLGQGIDYQDTPEGCQVLIEFADPELVSGARLAMTLSAPPNPILSDVSVGFDRQEWTALDDLTAEQRAAGAKEAMVRAQMDELSLVIRGAVNGAQMRDRRSWVIDGTVLTEPVQPAEPVRATKPLEVHVGNSTIDIDALIALAKRKAAGDIDDRQIRAALEIIESGTEVRQVDDPGALALAVDAALDAASACAQGVDITTAEPWAAQMYGLVVAAEETVDALLEALGIADPDDNPATEPVMPVTAAAPELEQRSVSDDDLDTLIATASTRSKRHG